MNKGTKWYTNGIRQLCLHPYEEIPEGFHRGRLKSSEETRRKVSQSLIGNSRKKGKKESESTRRKKSESMKGNKNSTGQDNHGHIGLIHIHKGDIGRKIKPELLKEYLSRGYSLGESPLHIKNKMSGNTVSKPELRIIKYLESKGLNVISQYTIGNYNHPYDIYVPGYKLLIEFDGDYWHRDTDYNNDPRELNAKSLGYNYVVIKECEYNSKGNLKHVKSVLSKFIDILKPTSQS